MERLTSVLDAWAILAWLHKESAYKRVLALDRPNLKTVDLRSEGTG